MSKNKFFATTATAALVASAIVPAAASAADLKDFDSVPGYAKEAVKYLADNDFVQGDQNQNFNPASTLMRAQAAEIIAKVNGLEANGEENFNDVKAGDWYYNAVVATSPEIFKGDDKGNFNPTQNLTRQEAAIVIVNAFGLTGSADLTGFADAKNVPTWAQAAFETAVSNGVINGKNGKLAPADNISNAEFAVMIKRAIDASAPVVEVPEVTSVSAIDTTTIKVVLSDNTTHEVNLETALVEGDNEVTFEIEGVEYTATVAYDVVLTSGISGFILAGTTPIEGATVTVNGKSVKTNEKGYYELLDVTPGTQEVTIEAEGYKTVTGLEVKVVKDEVSSFSHDIASVLINTAAIEVSGMIVDNATGAAIDGATVTIEKFDAETETWVEVASESTLAGAYTINQASATQELELGAEYRQTVSKAGYHEFVQTITLDNQVVENVLAGIQLDEIEAIDVTGTVTNAAGANVTSADVAIFDVEGTQVATSTVTNGEYSFGNLQLLSGTYSVVVDDTTSAVSYTEFEVVEGKDAVHNVQLEAGYSIDATIGTESLSDVFGATDANQAEYTLKLMNGNTVIDTQTFTSNELNTDSTLTFDFVRVAPGNYTLELSGDYVVTEKFAITVDGNETFEERAIPAGVISGAVTDSSAGNIPNATVNLLDTNGTIVATTKTLADGTYKFGGVAAGKYTVEVSADDYVAGKSSEVTLAKNETELVTTFALDAVVTTGDVAGYVRVSGSLAPVSGAEVVYYDADGEEVYSDTTGVDGSYELTALAAGTYKVVVRGTGVETHVTTQTIAAGDDLTAVNYNLTSGGDASLKITVVDSKGNPVDVAANGFDLSDAFVFDKTNPVFGITEASATTVDTITLTGLAAGTYNLAIDVESAEFVDVETTVSIASGEAKELKIVVDEVAAQSDVNFRVIDENNADVTDATVVVFNEDGTIKTVVASEDALALVDGNYVLAVYKNSYVVSKQAVTVAGKDVTVPVIQLSKVN